MTNRAATSRLYVALASLLTAALTLVASAVRLIASSLTWAAVRIEAASARAPRATTFVAGPAPRAATPPATRPAAASVIVQAPVAPPSGAQAQAERLASALTGLGFKSPDVRKFVAGLGARVAHETIENLIKLGLVELSTSCNISRSLAS
jgi:hypothetical protein